MVAASGAARAAVFLERRRRTLAAVDYFLKIDGIEGESTDAKHKGEIELHSFSWGETQAGAGAGAGRGAGGGAGKVTMQDLHVATRVSKASPQLMLACATGKHLKVATLVGRKAGKGQQEFLVYKFTDVLVSSYQTGGVQGELPTDQVSFNFARIEVEYRAQKADGSLDAPVKAGWDVKASKPV
jgi:type VI secretion system secreted protein Hcp